MPQNNPKYNTRYTPSFIGTLLCLLTVSALALPASAAVGNPQETCVDTTVPTGKYCNPVPSLLFMCNTEAVLKAHRDKLAHPLAARSRTFNGAAMHTNIANHDYKSAITILKRFPALHDEILNDVDVNNRTPLHLALEVGAPAHVLLKLITPKNVMMADKNRVTPLMLAARGADPSVTDAIIKAIGTARMQKALSAQDKSGNTVYDWNKLQTKTLNKQFENIEVDGSKSANYCSNSLFNPGEYIFLFEGNNPKTKDAYNTVGLEVGTSYIDGKPNFSIKATHANAERLLEIANGSSKDINLARNKLAKAWGVSNDRNNKFWRYIASEVQKVMPELSQISLSERYVDRQEENLEILELASRGERKSFTQSLKNREERSPGL